MSYNSHCNYEPTTSESSECSDIDDSEVTVSNVEKMINETIKPAEKRKHSVKSTSTKKAKPAKAKSYMSKINEILEGEKNISDENMNSMIVKHNGYHSIYKYPISDDAQDYWLLQHYDFNEIKNVPSNERWKHAKCSIKIHTNKDDDVSKSLNNLIEIITERFAKYSKKKNSKYYLNKLENDRNICNASDMPQHYIRSTPETSSFYWKNESGKKYKVFTNTPKRKLYCNLEEYNREDVVNKSPDEYWRSALKCILLSLSRKNVLEKLIMKQLNLLIETIENRPNLEDYDELELLNVRKYYVLKTYAVDEIKDVPLDERYDYTKREIKLSINYTVENDILNELNELFTLCAQRFEIDQDHKVYIYGRY